MTERLDLRRSPADVDVIVVGAGIAGLVCARELRRTGLDVAVLEARGRVGGRVCGTWVDGEPIELGGQFLGPGQDRAYALAHELGIEVLPHLRLRQAPD